MSPLQRALAQFESTLLTLYLDALGQARRGSTLWFLHANRNCSGGAGLIFAPLQKVTHLLTLCRIFN
jgi:hypothetical protein